MQEEPAPANLRGFESRPASFQQAFARDLSAAAPVEQGQDTISGTVEKPKSAPVMPKTGDYLADSEKYLRDLQGYKPENHNSRWHSIALTAARSFLQGLSSGSLTQALGAMIFGAAYGAFHPAADEEFAKDYNISTAEQGRAKEIARRMNDAHLKEAQLDNQKKALELQNYPSVQAAKERKAKLSELATRVRLSGGKLDPSDTTAVALADELGASPKRSGSGGAFFIPTAWRVVDRQLIGVKMENGQPVPVVVYDAGTDDAEERRLSISLAQLNATLAKMGQPPVEFTDRMPSRPPPAPYTGPKGPQPPNQTSAQPTPAELEKIGAGPQTTPPNNMTLSPPYTPAPGASSSGAQPPTLAPIPGAKPPVVGGVYDRRGGRRSRRASSSSPRSDEIGASLEARDSARYRQEAATARANAAAAKSRGEDDVAQQWENAARVAEENARQVGSRRTGASSTTTARPTPKKGDPLGILD